MNLKSRLFGKPWQQKDPKARAQAVSEDSDPLLEQELPRLAREDEAAEVRLAALKRINSESSWLEARLGETDPEILAAADRFLIRAVLKQPNPGSRSQRLQWLEKIKASESVRQLAQDAPEPEIRRAALVRISAQGFLGDCYRQESDPVLAAEILERIEQTSTLERLHESLRKTSKQRAQAVAKRLANIRADSGQDDPDHQAAETLVQRIEALTRGERSGQRAAELASLEQQWAEIRQPDSGLKRRFEGAADIVRASLNRPVAEKVDQPAIDEAATTDAGPSPELAEIAETIRSGLRKARKGFNSVELLSEWDRRWNRIAAPNESDQALKEEMLPILRELQAQADFKAQQRKDKESAAGAKDSASDALNSRVDQLAELLEGGDIAAAHKLLGQLRSEFKQMPAKARPQALAGRFQRMEGRLKEKRDWQHWSNNQHRDELIEQVTQLADSGQHPDAISATLKDARDEWQRLEKLEVLPGDRKRFAAPSGQWRRFQAACQKAFDQAKPYFEKRNEVQDENREQLDQFIELGMKQAADESIDSKVLLSTRRAARQAIRRLDDLPPRTRGKSAARLRELMDKISARLDQLFGEIEQTKRKLVEEAHNLSQETDIKTAVDKAKSLQAQWQKAGSGRRKVEQKLWKEFRQPIDALFAQLKGERDEQKQVQKAVTDELKNLCQQAEALLKLEDAELEDARPALGALSSQWHSHDNRPGKLNQRFDKARAAFHQRIEQMKLKSELSARARIDELADAIQAIWNHRMQKDSDGAEALVPEARSDDTAEALGLIEKARGLAQSELSEQEMAEFSQSKDEDARLVVVELEFLSGLDSPEADRALRMDYQVKRLARRMSEGDQLPALDQELQLLQGRWLESLPHSAARHDDLARRYRRSVEILLKMSGQ